MSTQPLISVIDIAPLDVWHQIVEYACTDSGRTGRSLSLASVDLKNISIRYKYQSIHLPTISSLEKFERLVRFNDNARRVIYLHYPCPHIFPEAVEEVDEDMDYDDVDEDEDVRIADDNRKREIWISLLSQISGSLQVLSVFWVSWDTYHLQSILCKLPFLVELHIFRQAEVIREKSQSDPSLPDLRGWFPRLKRLSISGYRDIYGEGAGIGPFLARIAPGITHLRAPWNHLVGQITFGMPIGPVGPLDKVHSNIVDLLIDKPDAADGLSAEQELAQTKFYLLGPQPHPSRALRFVSNNDFIDDISAWPARWSIYKDSGRCTAEFEPWVVA